MQNEIDALKKQLGRLQETVPGDKLTMVIFSGELDKIMAAMIIANGATAMDLEVTLFFTFWATAALRDPGKKVRGKDLMSRMFGRMLPNGRSKLRLSKMNMMGLGTRMLKRLMKKKNVMSLDELFQQAGELGVKIKICEMSMDLMGFKSDEMIDYPHLEYCGVGTFLIAAEESKIQLFV